MQVSAVIPAYNEERSISRVIGEVKEYVNEVLVVDDGSTDRTAKASQRAGAEVLVHENNQGYLEALKTGFKNSECDVIVTLDADGEMSPEYIPALLEPIENDEADLVLGRRESIPRLSERFLSSVANLSVGVHDTGSGFRAIRVELAKAMNLSGVCPCGTFVLEAKELGGRITEIPIRNIESGKPKVVAWKHFVQLFYVLKLLTLGP